MCNDYGQALFCREGYPPSPFTQYEVELLTEAGRAINNPESQHVIDGMFAQINAYSPHTGAHISRVEISAEHFGKFLGLPPLAILALKKGFLLHDQGKLRIDNKILEGNILLTPEEVDEIFFDHSEDGAKIIKAQQKLPIAFQNIAAEIALTHHESFDGSGYPKGLIAKSTRTFGRLARVIDTLDVIAHRGQYQQALGIAAALMLMNDAGNPRTVGKFDLEILSLVTHLHAEKKPPLLAERRLSKPDFPTQSF